MGLIVRENLREKDREKLKVCDSLYGAGVEIRSTVEEVSSEIRTKLVSSETGGGERKEGCMARAGRGAGRKQSWEHPGTTVLGFALPWPRRKHMLYLYSFTQTALTITCLWMVFWL